MALGTLQLARMSHLLGLHCLQDKQDVVDLHGPLCITPKIHWIWDWPFVLPGSGPFWFQGCSWAKGTCLVKACCIQK